MEYSFLLVVCQAMLLTGAGMAFITPLRKRPGWQWWFPVILALSILPMDMGYRASDGGMIVLFHVLTYLVLLLMVNRCTMLGFFDTCYCAIWIMIAAELVQEVWFTSRLMWIEFHVMDLQASVGLLCFAAVLFFLLSRTLARWIARGDLYQVNLGQLLCAIVVGSLCVALGYLFLMSPESSLHKRAVIILCQFFCGTLMFLHSETAKRRTAEYKVDILNLLCSFGAQQYETAAENVRIVNEKCGELEEKIRQMEQYLPEEFRAESRAAILDARRSIDHMVKSGNEVLDIVLTEKNLLAETQDTRITCVADGKLLDFMETVDIYALFSYGLAIAMEDVTLFSEKNHRLIDLVVHECQNFAVIHLSHPFTEELGSALQNRTKMNNYKLLVIHRIVEKYHGMHIIEKKNGFFNLKILFPLSVNKK